MKSHRIFLAFLIAPLVVPFVFLLPLPGQDGSGSSGHLSALNVLPAILILAVYTIPLAYLGELFLGLPAWIVFKHYNVHSFPAFAAGGAFLGLLFYLIMETMVGNFAAYSLAREFNPLVSPYLDIDVVAASASAALFRAVVFPRGAGKPLK